MASYDVSAINFGENTYNFNKVRQAASTTASWRPILLHRYAGDSATANVVDATDLVYAASGVSVKPSTKTIRANAYSVQGGCTISWNATDEALEFVFL